MQLDQLLLRRQTGGGRGYAYRGGLVANEELVARLQLDGELETGSANTQALAFDDSSLLLACAGEDSRVRLYQPESVQLLHCFDPVRRRAAHSNSGGGAAAARACSLRRCHLLPTCRATRSPSCARSSCQALAARCSSRQGRRRM